MPSYISSSSKTRGGKLAKISVVAGLTLIATVAPAATDLYVACHDSRNIVRFDGITGAYKETLVPPSQGNLQRAHDMIFGGPNRNFYVADGGRSAVLEFNARTGALVRSFSNGNLGDCWGVDFAPNGNILTFGASSNAVYEFDVSTGAYLGTFISPGAGGLNSTRGLVFGTANDCYVSGGSPARIRKYNATTKAYLGLWGDSVSWGDLNDIEYGPDGNMFVLDRGFNARNIHKLNATTGASMGLFVSQGQGGISVPSDQVFGPNGNLFVSDIATHQIYQFSGTTGLFINIFASGAGMVGPNTLVFADVGDSTVPTSFLVTTGEHFEGDLSSLAASDDSRLTLFNSPATFVARIEIGGTTTTTSGVSHYAVSWETSVARLGLIETLEIRNYAQNTWTLINGSVASLTDRRTEFTVSTTPANFVSGAGAVRCRLKWEPINDEDPSQDGWLHSIDQVEWTIH